jgi:hypothetical protein
MWFFAVWFGVLWGTRLKLRASRGSTEKALLVLDKLKDFVDSE